MRVNAAQRLLCCSGALGVRHSLLAPSSLPPRSLLAPSSLPPRSLLAPSSLPPVSTDPFLSPPSHFFMTGIVMSLELWAASDWATQGSSLALSDSGTRSNHHPGHRAINHPAGTELHFLNSYQFLQGTKRPLWASSS
ncbi:hypothetical protein NQZ68_015685 [Dissostichus eleginoides]|nr:hypothetical protein NQZ68_015685 [Dissostichus eleginoides]